MTRNLLRSVHTVFMLAAVPAPLLLCGCEASGPSELTMRPVSKPFRLDAAIRVPGDTPFTILSSPSQENPAPGGVVQSHADSAPAGQARAVTSVEHGGAGSATFQLGAAFKNETDRQVDVTVSARYRYEFTLGTDARTRSADGTLSLHFFARDQFNRLLRDVSLLSQSTEQGTTAQSGENQLEFTVTIGARDSLYLFFGGAVGVDTLKSARTARAELLLTDVALTVSARAAPAVTSAVP